MESIVITEFMDTDAVNALSEHFNVIYDKTLVNHQDKLLELVADCGAIIVRNKTQVRGSLLEAAGNLRVVGRLGVGLDNIDMEECRRRIISVIPATGANNISVAEYVMAGLLMLARGCYLNGAEVAAGGWPRERMVGGEICGKTLGLLGFGGIARDVARRAAACGMKVIAHDPFVPDDAPVWKEYGVPPVALDAMLAEADAISLHVPLNDRTRNLFNAERIAAMKPGAFLINTARGGIVDETALAEALRSGGLGGAMLDVFAAEPLPGGTALAGAPNCLLTPHIAGVTHESNRRVSAMIAEKVSAALKGEPA